MKLQPTAEWEENFKHKYEGANAWSSMGIESVIKDIHDLLESRKLELISEIGKIKYTSIQMYGYALVDELVVIEKLGFNHGIDRVIELIKEEKE